ncbi:hypothetical protein AB1Y20_002451 [Prymnesium parvum]|uniref:Uncharacterized protein n=1 Tax=Prymnesium parvum TaxID=97485 RepID=A0AB34JBQ4_PRYPA
MADLVLEEEDFDEEPMFQKASHEGDGAAMVAKEADKETAGDSKGIEVEPAASGGLPKDVPDADGKPSAKAVLCGDSGVGKTSLLVRFAQGHFASSRATIGVDLQTQLVEVPGGQRLKLQVWDTAGQEQFQSLTSSYFRRAHAVILVYDVNNPSSFRSLGRWMAEVDRLAPVEVCKVVVGAKSDAGAASAVTVEEAEAFAAKHGAMCERCSARDATNVKELFERVAVKIVRSGFEPDGKARQASENRVSLGGGKASRPPKKGGCC